MNTECKQEVARRTARNLDCLIEQERQNRRNYKLILVIIVSPLFALLAICKFIWHLMCVAGNDQPQIIAIVKSPERLYCPRCGENNIIQGYCRHCGEDIQKAHRKLAIKLATYAVSATNGTRESISRQLAGEIKKANIECNQILHEEIEIQALKMKAKIKTIEDLYVREIVRLKHQISQYPQHQRKGIGSGDNRVSLPI